MSHGYAEDKWCRASTKPIARLWVCVIACVGICAGWPVAASAAERPQHDGKVVLFGDLHAHSKLSYDVKAGNEQLPAKAFASAQQRGLDFLAITDHHHPSGSYHLEASDYKTLLYDAAASYNAAHPGDFIAIPGIEWGVISAGNHVNVFGAPGLPPDDVLTTEYNELYEWQGKNGAAFAQFNHPPEWRRAKKRNTDVGNFGQALYDSTSDFVRYAGSIVRTVAVICGGKFDDPTGRNHRDAEAVEDYEALLNMGFHLSPTGDQDTHWDNWGVSTAARAAVWADAVSYDALLSAIKANRVYASEDDELVVAYQVTHGGKTYWMGDTVDLGQDEADVEFRVKIWQSKRSDPTLADEGPYTVEIVSDSDGIGGSRAATWDTCEVPQGQLKTFTVPVGGGEYVYLKVTEQNGKDNPKGDGEDEYNNTTGNHGADGKRDDMNDSAWTSPVWFVGPQKTAGGPYVWSKASDLYHDPDCWAAKKIGSANRCAGEAPAGKTKHNCSPG